MGCDIHGYIEYRRWEEGVSDTPYWNFGDSFGERDYAMFGLLAGVRMDGCLFHPRGIPDGISYVTKNDYCLMVTDNDDSDGCTTRERAEGWVKYGHSKWMNAEHTLITHPDWHTPSWLTTEEFETVINKRKEHEWEMSCEWDAILAAMKCLPNARFVFWFDN